MKATHTQIRNFGKLHLDRIMEAIEEDDNIGFCVCCESEQHHTEPDAEYYTCEECEAEAVFGAEQLLLSAAG